MSFTWSCISCFFGDYISNADPQTFHNPDCSTSISTSTSTAGAIEYGIENGEDYIKVYDETPTGNIRWRKSFYRSDRKSQEFETSGHRFEDFELGNDPSIAYFDVPEQSEHER